MAKGTAADVSVNITPQGAGEVVIGTTGGGIIQASTGDDLSLLGGSGAGNLFLFSGGSGKVYYGTDATNPDLEVATVGGVTLAITTAVTAAKVYQVTQQFTGDQTLTIDSGTLADSIILMINGLGVEPLYFSYDGSTHVVTVNTAGLGYSLDSTDKVVLIYDTSTNPY